MRSKSIGHVCFSSPSYTPASARVGRSTFTTLTGQSGRSTSARFARHQSDCPCEIAGWRLLSCAITFRFELAAQFAQGGECDELFNDFHQRRMDVTAQSARVCSDTSDCRVVEYGDPCLEVVDILPPSMHRALNRHARRLLSWRSDIVLLLRRGSAFTLGSRAILPPHPQLS